MKWIEFFCSRAVTLCSLGIGFLVFSILFLTAGGNFPLYLVCASSFWILVFAWLFFTWLTANSRLKRLEKLIEQMDRPYLLGELLPPPTTVTERGYFEIMKAISHSAIGLTEQASSDKEDYMDYVESWIHEIKTPLTTCSLILENGSSPEKLRQELKQAENLTDTILYYARLRSAEKDIAISSFNLSEAADEAIQSQMSLLIAARISIEQQGSLSVFSDKKAVVFILKQLLINCAKYCPHSHLIIKCSQRTLSVSDNGPGIPDYELPRVTERGFTGKNGRTSPTSTGMGLYIVSELCKKLGIELQIDSMEGVGTSISLSFPDDAKQTITKL